LAALCSKVEFEFFEKPPTRRRGGRREIESRQGNAAFE
jgi:hypothetical protein